MVNCNKMVSPSELNELLVPTCLLGMSKSEICAFIKECTKKSNKFKNQVLDFYYKMSLAKKYTAERKCYCPTKVKWSVPDCPLVISQASLCGYFDFVSSDNTGFAFILRKVMETIQRNKNCRNLVQDGKTCCCSKSKNCYKC